MKVLADTCVWSAALRRRSPDPKVKKALTELIDDMRLVIVGPIRQELLSGISEQAQFRKLRDTLAAFEDIQPTTDHYVLAAEFSNTCRARGVQGSTTDFLICAVAHSEKLAIFTTDRDFKRYAKLLPITLFS